MGQEDDTPRADFAFKPKEFERLNEPAGVPEDAFAVTVPDEKVAPRDVHEILRQNLEHDVRRGWFRVVPGEDLARRRRIKVYCLSLAAIDIPLGAIAWFSGHRDPFPFVCAIAAMAYFTGRLTWQTWFMLTER
jgi:hypothetical protein